MTGIADVNPVAVFQGDGSRGPFPFEDAGQSIPFAANAHLALARVSTAGVISELTLGVHYDLTVTLDSATSLYTAVINLRSDQPVLAGASGSSPAEKLVAWREQPLDQSLTVAYNQAFPSRSFNQLHNKFLQIAQEHRAVLDRAILAPHHEDGLTLGDALTEKGKVLGRDPVTGALKMLTLAEAVQAAGAVVLAEFPFTAAADQTEFLLAGVSVADAAAVLVHVGGAFQSVDAYAVAHHAAGTLLTFGEGVGSGVSVLVRVLGQHAPVAVADAIVSEEIAPGLAGTKEEFREYFDLNERSVQSHPVEAYAPDIERLLIDTGLGAAKPITTIADNGGGKVRITSAAHGLIDVAATNDDQVLLIDGAYYWATYVDANNFDLLAVNHGAQTFDTNDTWQHVRYRHVCSIQGEGDDIAVAYLFNDSHSRESQDGQFIGVKRSSDGGATFLPAVGASPTMELNSGDTATNPLDPAAEAGTGIQGECHYLRDATADEEILVSAIRGATYNKTIISFHDGDAWTNYGLRFTSPGNAPSLSSANYSGAAASGYKWTYTIDGAEYEVVPYKPFFNNDGELVIPLTGVNGGYGSKHRTLFLIRSAAGAWRMGGVVPKGELGEGAAWEPATWQAEDGLYYCQPRNNSGSDVDNHAIAVSPNLIGWSPYQFLDEDVHLNRNVRFKVRDDLWAGLGVSDDTLRNHGAAWMSGDGSPGNFVHGTRITDETDGAVFAHYLDGCVIGAQLHCVYSQGPSLSGAPPTQIYYARLETLPSEGALAVMASDKNKYELGSGTSPSFTGDVLTLPPQMIGSMVGRGRCYLRTIRYALSTAANANPNKIYSVGDEEHGYFQIIEKIDGSDNKLYVRKVFADVATDYEIATIAAPTEYRHALVFVNTDSDFPYVSAFGHTMRIGEYAREYVGDTDPSGAQAGNTLIDVGGCDFTQLTGEPCLFSPDLTDEHFGSVRTVGGVVAGGAVDAGGNITTTAGHLITNRSADAAPALIRVQRDAGQFGRVEYYTTSSFRWQHGVDNAAEGGANAGSDFFIRGFDDSGNSLGDYFKIIRATGRGYFSAGFDLGHASDTTFTRAAAGVPAVESRTWPIITGQSGTAVPLTGSTSETTLVTESIPAGLMGAHGCVRITVRAIAVSGGAPGNRTVRVKFNGTAYLATAMTSTQLTARYVVEIWNAGATNSQVGHNQAGNFGASTATHITSSHDTTAAIPVLITGQLADGGDTLTVTGYSVEVLPKH